MNVPNFSLAACLGLSIAMTCTPVHSQSAAASESETASTFKTNCAICHGVDGAGTALGNRFHTPDLRNIETQKKGAATLAKTISAGRNNMPAFANKLSAEEIDKLAAYVHQFRAETTKPPE